MRHSLKFSPYNQTTLESCIVKGGNWRGVTDGWMETWTSLATALRGTSWSRWNHHESTLWFDPSSSLPSKGDMAGRCLSAWPFVSTSASESMRLATWNGDLDLHRRFRMKTLLRSLGLSANQPAVFFSHTKSAPATNQPAVLFSHNKSTQLPATAKRTEWYVYLNFGVISKKQSMSKHGFFIVLDEPGERVLGFVE